MTVRITRPSPRTIPLLALSLSLLLTACAVPGSHMRYDAKADDSLRDKVDIQAITPALLRSQSAESGENGKARPERTSLTPPKDTPPPENYDYRIGQGDVLNIVVYDHPELTIPAGSERSAAESGNVVHSNGTIFYPYIDEVDVAGRTVRQVRDEIQKRLAEYIAEPQVDVSVAAFNAQKAYVTGQVTEPGRFPITNVPARVLDALSGTGGLTEMADWHNVVLTREGRDIELSVYDMLTHGDLEQNLLLRDGDVLHVPDTGNQQVYVMGEVNDPQAFTMGNSRLSLTNAVSRAGGIVEGSANASGIFVVRRNAPDSDKFATVYQLDARNAAAFVLGAEFMLQPTDVVYVTAAPMARWNRVLSQIMPSITALYQATRIGETGDLWGNN